MTGIHGREVAPLRPGDVERLDRFDNETPYNRELRHG